MRRLLYALIAVQIILLSLLLLPPVNAQDTDTCDGAPPTRLLEFGFASVIDRRAVGIYAEPNRDSRLLTDVPAGEIMNIIGQATCVDGERWWRSAYMGELGWTAEGEGGTYYLEPYFKPEPVVVARTVGDQAIVETPQLRFRYPVALSSGVTYQPRIGFMVRDAFGPTPNHDSYYFPDYPIEEREPGPDIDIYPIDAWDRVSPDPMWTIYDLVELLYFRPVLPLIDGDGEEAALPYLPNYGYMQLLRVQPEYMTFGNGAGIRFITYLSVFPGEIRNRLTYTFQGLTYDERYYVAADFPVQVPESVFPDFDQDAHFSTAEGPLLMSDYFRQYAREVTANLNALAPDDFTPNLETLDAIIDSMLVYPTK